MRRITTALLALTAAACSLSARADVTVLAVRLGAKDVATLAKFYESAFGLKEIDRVGQPPTEIILRYGTSVASAKAGSSPEFLVTRRESAVDDSMPHAIFRVSDLDATVASARKAGATLKGEVRPVKIGNMSLRLAMMSDPDGNVLELMELPKGADHLQHP